jgi:hypothetical protein
MALGMQKRADSTGAYSLQTGSEKNQVPGSGNSVDVILHSEAENIS